MPQNRNKLIELLIGNLANVILHQILEQASDDPDVTLKYRKEIEASWKLAKKYREQIHPLKHPFPEIQLDTIRKRLLNKVKAKLSIRIAKGYKNLYVNQAKRWIDEALKKLNITKDS